MFAGGGAECAQRRLAGAPHAVGALGATAEWPVRARAAHAGAAHEDALPLAAVRRDADPRQERLPLARPDAELARGAGRGRERPGRGGRPGRRARPARARTPARLHPHARRVRRASSHYSTLVTLYSLLSLVVLHVPTSTPRTNPTVLTSYGTN